MKRRNFLRASSAMSLPFFTNGLPISALMRSTAFNTLNGDSDRVLVLIQLNGGNDGLNTLVPIDQYDKLANVRPNIILPEDSLLKLNDTNGLHPVMTGLADIYENAKLKIVQSVAYPNQNRSHFRSTDIWTSGSAADDFITTGWLGRYFDKQYAGFPANYPNSDCPDPFAITIGNQVSGTCQGIAGNFSLAVNNPSDLGQLPVGQEGSVDPNSCYAREIDYLRTTIAQSNAYATVINAAADNGSNLANYPADNRLAGQLKTVAQLIAGGLQTKVYVVSLGGFDTHANQVNLGDVTGGDHANLLKTLSDAVAVFQEDLKLLDLEKRVIGMTFSEFGRRIQSNAALGTDHGTAAPLMLFGSCVQAGILGDNPEISDQVDPQEGVAMQYDFRSVYGSVLMDWFGVEESEVRSLLYQDFQYLPLLQLCQSVATEDPVADADSLNLSCFPNPFQDWTTIRFTTNKEWARISIFDALGSELKVLSEQQFPAGEHQLRWDSETLPKGTYFCRIVTKERQKTKRLVKV